MGGYNNMSKYTQQEETEIVRDAMRLTTAIQIENEELDKQKSASFKQMPAAPFRKILDIPQIKAQIPAPPKSNYSYSNYLSETVGKNTTEIIKIVLLAWITCGIYLWYFLYTSYFKNYKKIKQEMDQQLAQNEEYLRTVEDIKKKASEEQQRINQDIARQQAEIDAKYKSDLEHYNTVVVPNYKKELLNWENIQTKKIAMLEEDLKINQDTLEELYDTTKLISLTYRKLWILRWLYDDMRTSDHDIRYATELLDRDRQRIATEQSGRMVRESINSMHSTMMSGFSAVYEAIEDGNEILIKTRREQNLANVAEIIQNHNLNKRVKAQGELFDKYFNKK